MLDKKEIRGWLLAVKGGGLLQLFAIAMGIPELYRFAALRYLCWFMVGVGLVLALTGLYVAANHEKS